MEVKDTTHLHNGHLLKKKRLNTHFSILIVSDIFVGKNILKRHMMVYKVLDDFLASGVHSLKIKTRTLSEFKGG